MPPDKLTVEELFITDPNTGKRIEFKGVSEVTLNKEYTSRHERIKRFTDTRGFIGTAEIRNMKALRELLYKSVTLRGPIEELTRAVPLFIPLHAKVVHLNFKQNKNHKKKRINKKWAKRYGYTCTVFYECGN